MPLHSPRHHGDAAESSPHRTGIFTSRNAVYALLLTSVLASGAVIGADGKASPSQKGEGSEETIPEYRRNLKVVPDGTLKREKPKQNDQKPERPTCPPDEICVVV